VLRRQREDCCAVGELHHLELGRGAVREGERSADDPPETVVDDGLTELAPILHG
jgi:hypothetical protein